MSTTIQHSRGSPAKGPAHGRARRGVLMAHEVGALLRLAGPIIVAQLGGIAMNITDTVMVAPLGPVPLAAAGLANGVHVAALITCGGMVAGMSPLVSQAVGRRDPEEARRVLVQGLWLAALMSLPVMLLSLLGRPVALRLGQDPEVALLAGSYLRVLAPGVLPIALFGACKYYLDGIGRPRVAMTVMLLGIGLNVAGNQALIYGVPGVVRPMGVVGSGVSTSIVRWGVALAIGAYVALHPQLTPLRRVSLRPQLARIRRILAIGAPIGAQHGAEVGIFALAAVMMGWMGPVQLAAHQITISLASATFMVAVGASSAGSIRVGMHVGARRLRAVHRAVRASYLVTLGFMSLCAITFLTLPRPLLRLYTHDPAIVATGTGLLFMAALFQVFDGAQVTGLAVLRGAADTRAPMWITLLGYWGVGLPVAYLLGFHTPLRHVGIWSGLTVSLGVVGVLLGWRVRRVLWQQPLRPLPRGGSEAADAAEAELLAAGEAGVAVV